MIPLTEVATRTRAILETDRVWSAYALADLDPEESVRATWYTGQRAVVLVYHGLTPPVLFAHGDPAEALALLAQVPGGEYGFTLLAIHRALLGDRLATRLELPMWRMGLEPADFRPAPGGEPQPLGPRDLGEILALFADYPDRPDAFHERQLASGAFFGIRDEGTLVSVAGTHIVSTTAGVAAIGNVFTRPDRRGRGFGTHVTSTVVAALVGRGLRTIVLNVAQHNLPAVRCYRRLGFREHSPYTEGFGQLAPRQPSRRME